MPSTFIGNARPSHAGSCTTGLKQHCGRFLSRSKWQTQCCNFFKSCQLRPSPNCGESLADVLSPGEYKRSEVALITRAACKSTHAWCPLGYAAQDVLSGQKATVSGLRWGLSSFPIQCKSMAVTAYGAFFFVWTKKQVRTEKKTFWDMYFGPFSGILKAQDRTLTRVGSYPAANVCAPRKIIDWLLKQKISSLRTKKKGLVCLTLTLTLA